jgi:hypothetical protein
VEPSQPGDGDIAAASVVDQSFVVSPAGTNSTPPTSTVAPLPPISTTPSFTVSWSGSDNNGSGLSHFDVYVSDNGGAFTPWLLDTTETSAVYAGTQGHTYGFYSVATDNFGYQQPAPAAAQASTTVAKASPQFTGTPTQVHGNGVVILKDSVTFSPIGYNHTGTLTFTLYSPSNTVVGKQTVQVVSGTETYSTSTADTGSFQATAAGTYQWVVSYSGDASNNGFTSAQGDEPSTVTLTTSGVTHGLGYWGGTQGAQIITQDDLTFLTGLKLVNASGKVQDWTTGTLCTNLSNFQTWLGSANAKNMAYMLSAQMAAMWLNVRHSGGVLTTSTVVYVGSTQGSSLLAGLPTYANGYVTLGALLTAADNSLIANPYTPAGSSARSYQEALKNVFDALDNDQTLFIL